MSQGPLKISGTFEREASSYLSPLELGFHQDTGRLCTPLESGKGHWPYFSFSALSGSRCALSLPDKASLPTASHHRAKAMLSACHHTQRERNRPQKARLGDTSFRRSCFTRMSLRPTLVFSPSCKGGDEVAGWLYLGTGFTRSPRPLQFSYTTAARPTHLLCWETGHCDDHYIT